MKTTFSILILAGALAAGCGASRAPREATAETRSAPIAVQALAVSPSEWPATYEAVGTVRARSAAVLSARVMGYVREVKVATGDRVRQGEVLVLLDARDLDAATRQAEAARNEAQSALPESDNALAAAKANLDLAQVTFRRIEDLFNKKSVSNQEFDEASAKLKVAEANYRMAQARRTQLTSKIAQAEAAYNSAQITRSYSEITAPFDGTVTEKTVEPGNLTAPGAPLVTIEKQGAYRLEVSVEESKLAQIRAGQSATVTLDALGRSLEGRVSEIVPAVDAAARSFTVKIDLPASPQLRSGLFGRARFNLGRRQAVAVPAATLQERGQLLSVLVAEGGFARARLVTVGQKSRDRVEVLSGLSPGDRVIFPAPAGLWDGARVEVRP
jgi:multidrug efflux pump subunit AcrA (membrane-fusion protein)